METQTETPEVKIVMMNGKTHLGGRPRTVYMMGSKTSEQFQTPACKTSMPKTLTPLSFHMGKPSEITCLKCRAKLVKKGLLNE